MIDPFKLHERNRERIPHLKINDPDPSEDVVPPKPMMLNGVKVKTHE